MTAKEPSITIKSPANRAKTHSTLPPPELAVLVAVETPHSRVLFPTADSVAELGQLAAAAGAEVVGEIIQRLDSPSSSHYLGKGKLTELQDLVLATESTVVFFDDELSPTQQRNLEAALKVKVLDRTALILDIFARRAATREGQLQVELAQHEYLLPRLSGQWSHLERLGGGIGTRGPGESQLESDRRLIRVRIERLKRDLADVRRHRQLHRRRRAVRGVPVVALVGYTNAGKSTLLNAIAKANVLAEGKVFATLDPTTRRIKLPSQREVLLTDTVGFIQKLPTHLVAAFRATLEELAEAALLLHVFDISHSRASEQAQTVDEVLATLDLGDKPVLMVANKVDRLAPDGLSDEDAANLQALAVLGSGGSEVALVSAEKGWGLDSLIQKITGLLGQDMVEITVTIPYNKPALLQLFRRYGQVLQERHQNDGTLVHGRVPPHMEPRLAAYVKRPPAPRKATVKAAG